MAFASTAALAAAVTGAGGFGLVGAGKSIHDALVFVVPESVLQALIHRKP